MKTYECPHCGADDSTRCAVLPPTPIGGYSAKQLKRGRKVGCRRAYYTDLRLARRVDPTVTKES
jgi:transcription elongation factor Elf1